MSERVDAVDALDTPSSAGARSSRTRRAYFAIALLVAGIVAWGFWETYYSQAFARTDLPAIVHVHAAVFSIWVLVLVAQAAVVVAGNVRLHRRLGTAGMLYGALVFAVGLARQRRRAGAARAQRRSIRSRSAASSRCTTSPTCCCSARSSRSHSRIATAPSCTSAGSSPRRRRLCGAALGRVVPGNTPQYLLLWLSPLLALVAVDLATRRRVHWIPRRQRRAARRRVLQGAALRGADLARRRRARCCGHLSDLRRLFYDFSRIWTEGWPATA